LLEELVPRNLLQRLMLGVGSFREHDPEDADALALVVRLLDDGGLPAMPLGPMADLLVVGRGAGRAKLLARLLLTELSNRALAWFRRPAFAFRRSLGALKNKGPRISRPFREVRQRSLGRDRHSLVL
jgi:hypothetical protein